MTISLGYRPPLAMRSLFSFLADRTIPGVETFDGKTLRRATHTRTGGVTVIGLTPNPTRASIVLDTASDDASDLAGAVEAARRLLDLDADPTPIDRALAQDRVLRPWVRATPGMRLPGAIDGFELAVRAVLGQQISVRAARTFAGRIAIAAGTALPSDHAVDGITHAFPTAEQLAAAPLETIGLTNRRIDTLHRLATLVASGTLNLSGAGDLPTTKELLLAIPGIGPWTVSYVAMRALHDADAFPVTDLGIRLGFEALGLPSSVREIRDRAEGWRPWRGYAAMHVWQRLGVTA